MLVLNPGFPLEECGNDKFFASCGAQSLILPRLGAIIIFFTLAANLSAQTYLRDVQPFLVRVSTDSLLLPFAGGFDKPDQQFIDIDLDGDLDLFVFDESDGYMDFYRNIGTPQSARFSYQRNAIALPKAQLWFRFGDLNNDGLPDLLIDNGWTGVNYYRNDGPAANPVFTLVEATMTDPQGNWIISGAGIPALIDIDGDTLVDFFSNNPLGTINFYKNVGTPTEPQFDNFSSQYQNIYITGDRCTTFTSTGSEVPFSNMHGAGTFSFADADGDGAVDLFYGDQYAAGLFFIKNHGTRTTPELRCNNNQYPPSLPVQSAGFNQASVCDIDNDGDNDLFVSVVNGGDRSPFRFYENVGTAQSPNHVPWTNQFVSMIDVGRDAHPAIGDIDGDGDLDFLIGSNEGPLWYFRNDGTAQAPRFQLADTNFGGINGPPYETDPAIADFDADGDMDIILGNFVDSVISFSTGTLRLYTNTSGQYQLESIYSSTKRLTSPVVGDIDGDNDLDLLFGGEDGRISFYRNSGSAQVFIPAIVSDFYAGIDVGQQAKPAFRRNAQSGLLDLVIGNEAGILQLFRNTGTATDPIFNSVADSVIMTDSLRSARPAFGDFNGDGVPEMLVGTSRGGVQFYREEPVTEVIEQPAVQIPTAIQLSAFPNPFNPRTVLSYSLPQRAQARLTIANLLGEHLVEIDEGLRERGEHRVEFDGNNLPSGVYFAILRIHFNDGSESQQRMAKLLLVR